VDWSAVEKRGTGRVSLRSRLRPRAIVEHWSGSLGLAHGDADHLEALDGPLDAIAEFAIELEGASMTLFLDAS
jgi:hypothetical protein